MTIRNLILGSMQYTWSDGRIIAEREGHRYAPHVYEKRGERWVFRAGHWDDE